MKSWYWIIDVEKCENCQNCFLACRDEHFNNDWSGYSAAQGDGQKWVHIKAKERGQNPFIDVAYLPVPCMHCDDAPCVKAASDGAIYKRNDGIVIIDPVKSKGQQNLVDACPYHQIWWNDRLGLPQKCTFCAHLIDDGWSKSRCVQSCPTGALSMIHVTEPEMNRIISEEKLEVYKPALKTKPRVFYKNLHKFTRCFIGGSVAVNVNGVDECAEGAKVALFGTQNEQAGQCITDSFGDFKFDNLPDVSSDYMLQIEYRDYPLKNLEVHLAGSVYTGVIYL